jgi:2-amino-4-hydroxy-6-hydroxymethyldihydropteridine diphosphokinase
MAASSMLVTAYIGLGSNLNNPELQIERACQALARLPESHFIRCSSLYRSEPMLVAEAAGELLINDAVLAEQQPDYINAVVALETRLSPLRLLDALQLIEQTQGRDRNGPRWGPRTLDLDILLYDQHIINEPRLTVPHAGMAVREFVLYPLYQIAPQLVLPGGHKLRDWVIRCPLRGLQCLQMAEQEAD